MYAALRLNDSPAKPRGSQGEEIMVLREEPILTVAVCDPSINDLALTRAIVRKAMDTISVRCRAIVHAYPTPEALLTARPCDICVTEVDLGAMDGFTLAGEVRRRRPGAEIVFVTRRKENATALRGWKTQAAQYFVKPIEHAEDYTRLQGTMRMLARRLLNAPVQAKFAQDEESEKTP